MLRQEGRSADCGTRLIIRFFVFEHRRPLGLRDSGADANDPARLAAICSACDQQKTPSDLKAIAKAKRVAAKEQDHRERLRNKVPGRPVPSRSQWRRLEGELARLRVISSELPSAEAEPNLDAHQNHQRRSGRPHEA